MNRPAGAPSRASAAAAQYRPALGALLWIQGVYFLVTGIWPLLDIDSFQLVTGPKTDLWLVRTVAVLVTVVGMTLISAARRKAVTRETFILGVGSALALAAIDIFYVSIGRIARIYLADAAAELAIVLAWLFLYVVAPRRAGQGEDA